MFTLGALADTLDVRLDGDPELPIGRLATLADAQPGDLSHCSSAAYRDQLATSKATAVILSADDRPLWPHAALVSDNPYLSYARASQLFAAARNRPVGDSRGQAIAADAVVDPSAILGPQVAVGTGAVIGPGVVLHAQAVVGAGCTVGRDSVIHARAVLVEGVRLGERCTIHSGAVLGASGFGFTPDERGHWVEIAQLGGVVVGNDVSIGANTTIDRGALSDTVIGDGVKIDNLCQIGHNTEIGAHTLICGCVGVVGSTKIGRHCVLAGGSGVGGDRPIELCDGVILSACCLVTQSVTVPGTYGSGTLHAPLGQWKRNALRFQQLDGMMRRVKRLERFLRGQGYDPDS